jgi:hypothetical protein
LESFPGKIVPDKQFRIDDTDHPETYCFYDPSLHEISRFLEKYSRWGYEIRDKKGGFVKVDKVRKHFSFSN